MRRDERIFNAPGIVLALIGALVAIHLVRLALPEELDVQLLLSGALIPWRFTMNEAPQLPGGALASWTQLVTHMLLHADATHLTINAAWLLAFGTVIARRFGAVRFLAFSAICGIAAAIAFVATHWGQLVPMIGASGAVSGLMGGAFRLFFPAMDLGGTHILSTRPDLVPAMSLSEAVRDRRVQQATIAVVAINVLLATGFGSLLSEGGIAWEAHLGGYFAGLAAFGVFDRPSNARRSGEHLA